MTDNIEKSPWFSIWTKPRSTIRHVINTDPKQSLWWLATIYILQTLLFFANYHSFGLNYHTVIILIISLVLAPFVGMIWLYLFGWVLHFTGKWLGGDAPNHHVRAALAWSKVPVLINLAMWFILLIFSSSYVFVQFSSGPSMIFIQLITLISGVWSLVILIQNISEIQGFSIGRAIGNWALFFVFGFIISFAITLLFQFGMGMIGQI